MDKNEYEIISNQLKEAAKKWNGESLETFLSAPAADALAKEANTTSFLLDIIAESLDIRSLMLQAATKLEEIAKKECEPSALDLIKSGQDWGRIPVPPKLLRSIWRIGEALDLFLGKHILGEEFEAEAMEMMEMARQWVRFHKGLESGQDVIQIDVLPLEAQEKLRQLNMTKKPDMSNPPF